MNLKRLMEPKMLPWLAAALVGSNLPGSKRGVGKGRGRRRRWH